MTWQQVRCDGCKYRCRYRDLKVFRGDAFTIHVRALFSAEDDPTSWVHRGAKRARALGAMFRTKQDAWKALLDICPNYGTGDNPPEARAIPFPKRKADEQRRYRARLPPGEHARRQREYRRRRREKQAEETEKEASLRNVVLENGKGPS